MATILDKDLVRESKIKKSDREIVVTLKSSQEIELKLKGMKTGGVSIDIGTLWNQLNGIDPEYEKKSISIIKNDVVDETDDSPMMSLNELRSQFCTSLKPDVLSQIEAIMVELIKDKSDNAKRIKKLGSTKRKK